MERPAHQIEGDSRRENIDRINLALEAGEQAEIVAAIRAEAARLGMNKVAARAGMKRSSLHAALKPGGNPTLTTIRKVARALGLTISVQEQDVSQW